VKRVSPLLWLATLYALYAARELFRAWQSAPLEHLSPLLFALWFFPYRATPQDSSRLLYGGLLLCVLGQLVEINMLSQLGLVAVLGYWRGRITYLDFISALLWLPVGGWLGAHLQLPQAGLFGLRLVGVGLAALSRRKKNNDSQTTNKAH
jgi:hypothetical protein